jgi:hypothetical protein
MTDKPVTFSSLNRPPSTLDLQPGQRLGEL